MIAGSCAGRALPLATAGTVFASIASSRNSFAIPISEGGLGTSDIPTCTCGGFTFFAPGVSSHIDWTSSVMPGGPVNSRVPMLTCLRYRCSGMPTDFAPEACQASRSTIPCTGSPVRSYPCRVPSGTVHNPRQSSVSMPSWLEYPLFISDICDLGVRPYFLERHIAFFWFSHSGEVSLYPFGIYFVLVYNPSRERPVIEIPYNVLRIYSNGFYAQEIERFSMTS